MYSMETMCFKNSESLLKIERTFRKFMDLRNPTMDMDTDPERIYTRIYKVLKQLSKGKDWDSLSQRESIQGLQTAFQRKRPRFLAYIVQWDQSRLHKHVFLVCIWQLSSLNGYTKQLKEETIKQDTFVNDCVCRKINRNKFKISRFSVVRGQKEIGRSKECST